MLHGGSWGLHHVSGTLRSGAETGGGCQVIAACSRTNAEGALVLLQIREAREGELQALTVEKYLDALCVYFWAATSILTSIITFTLYALLGHHLTADVVFTSLALFNVLIVPLNGFPWVSTRPRHTKPEICSSAQSVLAWSRPRDGTGICLMSCQEAEASS